MALTCGDVIVETLIQWGVEIVFGLPGDGINGIMEAFRTRQDKIKFVQMRHEEAAAFAACGYAKFTGKLGACMATSGPGGIHLLNGLYDAKMDGQPVIAITGLQFSDLIGTHTQQDVELDKLYQDVAVYNERIMNSAHARNICELACRTALTKRGVAHVCVPVDVQEKPVQDENPRNVRGHVSDVKAFSSHIPDPEMLQKAADILNAGKKVAILVGRGALGAGEDVERIAQKLGAPVIKALLGKAVIPDDSPFTTGGIGLLGTLPSEKALNECDTLLMVGTSFPYIEFMPKPGQARCVQIDLDPMRISLRYPTEVGIVADSRLALRGLESLIQDKEDKSFLEQAQKQMKQWRDLMQEREVRKDKPMKPQVVAAELGKRLDDDAIVTCDSGTIATWWARHIVAKKNQMYSLSGTLATMANGFPYAIAAALAFPERQVVAFVGDGGFSMLMAELATCVKYKLNVKVVIIKNNSLGQIKWEQMVFNGNPEFGCDLQPIDFDALAKAFGAHGFTSEDPETCGEVLDQMLSSVGPAVCQAVVDPLEPPLPAKISMQQAAHFTRALLKGEKDRFGILKTIVPERVREMI